MTDDTPNDKSEMDKSAPPVTDKGTGQTVMGQTVTNKSGAAEANNTPEDGMASAMTRNRMIKRTYEDPPTDELMGVYAAWAWRGDSQQAMPAVMNLGRQPTIDPEAPSAVEVHLLDAEVDLAGDSLRVQPLQWLRGQQAFGSLDELTGQISRDADQARVLLAAAQLPG